MTDSDLNGMTEMTQSPQRMVWRRHVAVSQAVFAERWRQVVTEGFSTSADDAYANGELALAASAYVLSAAGDMAGAVAQWPWAPDTFKPKNPRADMLRAAALCLAEIERLDRVDAQA